MFCRLVGRAFYVQVINKDFLQNKANANILRSETLKAMRGVISDRHGVPLAISSPIMKVVIDPREYFETKNSLINHMNYRRHPTVVNSNANCLMKI
jgi:cell division protein FtsI (penicillin-binding protein 3)